MPTEIIVAVITGCITLAGVLISNRRKSKNIINKEEL